MVCMHIYINAMQAKHVMCVRKIEKKQTLDVNTSQHLIR